jgi:hypothetical protein
MVQQSLQWLSTTPAWLGEALGFQPMAPHAAMVKEESGHKSIPYRSLLLRVANRSAPAAPGFDPKKMATALAGRIVGLELNLCDLNSEEERCLNAWLPEDWAAFQVECTAGGGRGIAYVELNAEFVPDFVAGLQQLDALECVSVWVPARGDSIDFGILSAGNEPLRINILGTPTAPLKITASQGVMIEGKEGWHPNIASSLVYRTDLSGVVSTVPVPLATRVAANSAPPPMPCVGDPELTETLVRLLQETARPARCIGDLLDARSVAQALIMCGSFDLLGDFGFNLERLTPQQARRVQALPTEAWTALQESAAQVGEDICWLKLHDVFAVTNSLVRSLNQLSPLFTLSVATPKNGKTINLGKLQNGAARLERVHVRCAPGTQCVVHVPDQVTVLPVLTAAADEETTSCEVIYEDRSGKVQSQRLLNPRAQDARMTPGLPD